MLIGSIRLLERSSLDRFLHNKVGINNLNNNLNGNNFSSFILEVAGGDNEAAHMLKFIEEKTGLLL